jgi:hypothetical protein
MACRLVQLLSRLICFIDLWKADFRCVYGIQRIGESLTGILLGLPKSCLEYYTPHSRTRVAFVTSLAAVQV